MKKILCVILFSIFAVQLHAQEKKKVTIIGTIPGLSSGDLVYLQNDHDSLAIAKSKNGKFEFHVAVDSGRFYFISIHTQNKLLKVNSKDYFTLFLDPSVVEVKGDLSNWPNVSAVGSKSNADYEEFLRLNAPFKIHLSLLQHKLETSTNSKDSLSRKTLVKQIRDNIDSTLVLRRKFILENLSSLYTPYLISSTHEFGYKEKAAIYQKLSKEAKVSYYGLLLRTNIEQETVMASVRVGTVIPDITSRASDGNIVHINNMLKNGKVTLIDFWASWCVPCRKEIPNLKKVYNDFHSSGFNIVSVSLDFNEKDWKEAIAKEQMPWTQVSELKGRNEYASKIFGLNGIPAGILIDSSGKILVIDTPGGKIPSQDGSLRGESLHEIISKFIGRSD